MLTPGADPVRKVSIIPRGHGARRDALGAPTSTASNYDERLPAAQDQGRARRPRGRGGRASTAITTGAESDIQQLTEIARGMVGRWGMSDAIGPIAVLPSDGHGPLLPGAPTTSETHAAARRRGGPADRRGRPRRGHAAARRAPRAARVARRGAAASTRRSTRPTPTPPPACRTPRRRPPTRRRRSPRATAPGPDRGTPKLGGGGGVVGRRSTTLNRPRPCRGRPGEPTACEPRSRATGRIAGRRRRSAALSSASPSAHPGGDWKERTSTWIPIAPCGADTVRLSARWPARRARHGRGRASATAPCAAASAAMTSASCRPG